MIICLTEHDVGYAQVMRGVGVLTEREDILFGEFSRSHKLTQSDLLAELDPDVVLAGTYLEDLDGYSGTDTWLARTDSLPTEWVRHRGDGSARMSETGVYVWRSQLDTARACPDLAKQAHPIKAIRRDDDPAVPAGRVWLEVDQPDQRVLACEAQLMKAIETLTGDGHWKFLYSVHMPEMTSNFRQLAYLDQDGEALGFLHPDLDSLPPLFSDLLR